MENLATAKVDLMKVRALGQVVAVVYRHTYIVLAGLSVYASSALQETNYRAQQGG